jgi:hypothetical protein
LAGRLAAAQYEFGKFCVAAMRAMIFKVLIGKSRMPPGGGVLSQAPTRAQRGGLAVISIEA